MLTQPLNKAFHGRVTVPGDKSISHRVLIAAALAKGTSYINGLNCCSDVISTVSALTDLGASVEPSEKGYKVTGPGLSKAKSYSYREPLKLFCGNSATCMRLLAGVVSGIKGDFTLTGDSSLSKRPMERICQPLNSMGASVTATGFNQTPPLRINGSESLSSIWWDMPVASAQVKSAILFGALKAQGITTIVEPGMSRDHTELLFKHLGVMVSSDVVSKKPFRRRINILGPATIENFQYTVPADPSSAAYPVALAILNPSSSVTVENVCINPGRMGFYDILKRMGANITVTHLATVAGEEIGTIEASYSKLKGVTIDANDIPQSIDELPLLAAVASQAQGTTILTDAKELRVKETDRISSCTEEMRKIGVNIRENHEGWEVTGGGKPVKGIVSCREDHRLEMSLAILGLIAKEPLVIEDSGWSQISFPGFWKWIESLY